MYNCHTTQLLLHLDVSFALHFSLLFHIDSIARPYFSPDIICTCFRSGSSLVAPLTAMNFAI